MTDLTAGLLPSNATAFERTHLEAMARAWGLDFDAIGRQSDPDTCDAALLPFLFFDGGGTVWSDAWTVERQRQVVRDLFTYKRLEGSPAGVEAYLNLADALVIDEELPPANAFLVPEDALDYAALVALMPELRLYHDTPPTYEPDAFFYGRDHWGTSHFVPSTAGPGGRYAVLVDQGVETPLGIVLIGPRGEAIVRLPAERGSAAFWGDAVWGETFFGEPAPAAAFTEGFSYAPDDPGFVLRRLENRRDPAEAFLRDGFWGDAFLVPDGRLGGYYDALTLWDPARVPSHTSPATGGAFWGDFRFGLPAYHAILTVALPGTPAEAPAAWEHWGAGFLIPHDPGPIAFAMQAAEAARRPGDRILIDLSPTGAGASAMPLPDLDLEISL